MTNDFAHEFFVLFELLFILIFLLARIPTDEIYVFISLPLFIFYIILSCLGILFAAVVAVFLLIFRQRTWVWLKVFVLSSYACTLDIGHGYKISFWICRLMPCLLLFDIVSSAFCAVWYSILLPANFLPINVDRTVNYSSLEVSVSLKKN